MLAQIDQMHLMASFLQVVHASCILSYALQETYSLSRVELQPLFA